MAFTPCY